MRKFCLIVLSTLLLSCFCYNSLYAAEYPWFKAQGFEGWIEYSGGSGADRRINVLPRLYGPSFTGEFGGAAVNTSNLLTIKPDGEISLKFLVMGERGKLPASFKTDVYNNLQATGFVKNGFTLNSIQQYQVVIPKINNLKAVLLVNGEVKQTVQIPQNTYTDAEFTGEFRIRPEDDIYGNIQNADFKIQLDYEFPYQTFSGASINLSQTALTTIKVDVFKQVIRQVRKSGTKFLWMDFRSTYVRTIEKERITTNASAQYTTNLDIVLRDPDEVTLKFIDDIMGKQEITKEKLIQQHEKLITHANQHNNPTLGKLSKEYIDAVRADDPTAQINVLDALSKLAQDDILGFLSSGISFSESSASGSYTYIASIQSNYSSTTSEAYSQNVIRTSKYAYRTILEHFPMMANVIRAAQEQQMMNLFGSTQPTPYTIDNTLVSMVGSNNLQNARYCLQLGASPNQLIGDDLDPLLNYSLKKGYLSLAHQLLKYGADPNLRNRHGEDAGNFLENITDKSLTDLINTVKPSKGRIAFNFIINPLGPEFNIENSNINFRVKTLPVTTTSLPNNNWSTSTIETFPGYYHIEINLMTYFLVPKNSALLSNPYEIQRYSNAGYTFWDMGSRVKISKLITLYDKIKVLKDGSNTYSYTLFSDPNTLAVSETSNKHVNIYNPTFFQPLDTPMFKF